MATLSNFYTDKLLADLTVGYGGQEFNATRIMPVVFSPDQTGTFLTFDASNMVVDVPSKLVSPFSDVPSVDFDASKTTYSCLGYGEKVFVPNAMSEDMAGSYLRGATQKVYGELLRIREKLVLDTVLACGNSSTITTKWNTTPTLGNIIVGVEAMKKTVRDAVGVNPNVLIFGTDVWSYVAQAIAAVGVGGTVPTTAYLANILGLSDVIIEAVTDKTTAAGTSSVLWTAKTAAMIFRGGTSQMTGGDLETNYFEPSYGKLVYWANSNLVNGIEWMRYEWANKGSHGGEYVKGVFYLDTVETMNDAATLGTVLS